MEPVLQTQPDDKSDEKASFRKPTNDAASRKYRRHSPGHGSDSSSSDGNHKRSDSLVYASEDRTKMSYRRRKDHENETDRESSRNRSGRSIDYHRHSDRQIDGNSYDSRRDDVYYRQRRYNDEEDKTYERSSRSGRQPRTGMHSDRYDSRYREHSRNGDMYSRQRSDMEHRSKDKERETGSTEHHKRYDGDSDRAVSGSRQYYSSRDVVRTGEKERHRDREVRDEKRDKRRSPGTYKNDRSSFYEESKEYKQDSAIDRDSSAARSKETFKNTCKSDSCELDRSEDMLHKRRNEDKEGDKRKKNYSRESENERQNDSSYLSSYQRRNEISETENEDSSAKKLKLGHSEFDEKPSLSSKQVKEPAEKTISNPVNSTTNQAEAAQDFNAAKVAAMKAAELVNKNLVGVSYMSTDQKKKLLWANKKSSSEESSNRWDLHLFPDRERQEKFNKLMGVKGDVNPERRPDDKDVEKQEQLQMDLEKQYTAGLRRRDGRTVGLGL